ncbi:hypothetical protein ACTVCO_05425 [Sanguibacter sp. A247]|uniref:hypothetical protein n=1 Tax=unclassified Sanguibacter TaxID=2645534 RepID=UPI003FD7966B
MRATIEVDALDRFGGHKEAIDTEIGDGTAASYSGHVVKLNAQAVDGPRRRV